jgi:hypothetical protein
MHSVSGVVVLYARSILWSFDRETNAEKNKKWSCISSSLHPQSRSFAAVNYKPPLLVPHNIALAEKQASDAEARAQAAESHAELAEEAKQVAEEAPLQILRNCTYRKPRFPPSPSPSLQSAGGHQPRRYASSSYLSPN